MQVHNVISYIKQFFTFRFFKSSNYADEKRQFELERLIQDGISPLVMFTADFDNFTSFRLSDLIALGYVRRRVRNIGNKVEVAWIYEGNIPIELDFHKFTKTVHTNEHFIKFVKNKGMVTKEEMDLKLYLSHVAVHYHSSDAKRNLKKVS